MSNSAKNTSPIALIGFDGDDTLWKSEDYYRAAELAFESILAQYLELNDATRQHLLAVEQHNLKIYGYGVKAMTLSMIETAIELTKGEITAKDIQQIMEIGHTALQHPVELLDGIKEVVTKIAMEYEIVLITKGDLFHQEAKITQSGLAELFPRIEIVSEKDPQTYQRVLNEFALSAEQFIMVGNSLRSDIAPVIEIGGWGIHIPYPVTWAHEAQHNIAENDPRVCTIATANELPKAIIDIQQKCTAKNK